jgi:hypothetical protein
LEREGPLELGRADDLERAEPVTYDIVVAQRDAAVFSGPDVGAKPVLIQRDEPLALPGVFSTKWALIASCAPEVPSSSRMSARAGLALTARRASPKRAEPGRSGGGALSLDRLFGIR